MDDHFYDSEASECSPCSTRGTSWILVAAVVLSIGLLGLLAINWLAPRSGQEASWKAHVQGFVLRRIHHARPWMQATGAVVKMKVTLRDLKLALPWLQALTHRPAPSTADSFELVPGHQQGARDLQGAAA